ncbi:hypothetical protein BpHYR1_015064 [Brachionus plicatilis]|uniref:Uncharacterized protein n=1 Tax=Brachionus plicatilis TaxID=10195 RepID=A0A3M7SN55_BRAPC|nr:hypothetical protein BpHYR1_015064 [Brachionus plicatilis]
MSRLFGSNRAKSKIFFYSLSNFLKCFKINVRIEFLECRVKITLKIKLKVKFVDRSEKYLIAQNIFVIKSSIINIFNNNENFHQKLKQILSTETVLVLAQDLNLVLQITT